MVVLALVVVVALLESAVFVALLHLVEMSWNATFRALGLDLAVAKSYRSKNLAVTLFIGNRRALYLRPWRGYVKVARSVRPEAANS